MTKCPMCGENWIATIEEFCLQCENLMEDAYYDEFVLYDS
jgi:hypothetical protein